MKLISLVRRWSKILSLILSSVLLLLLLGGCAEKESNFSQETVPSETENSSTDNPAAKEQPLSTEAFSLPEEIRPAEELTMMLRINDKEIAVRWEENESVEALKDLIQETPLTINMSMYGGFEQVGSLGTSLPRNDTQTTTQAGDIVLYSGNQIVVFYGSNSWSYTRLGHVELSAAEMTELLSRENVIITLYVE
jgi:hypothetical protein